MLSAAASCVRWHAEPCVQNSAQRAMVESQKMFEDMIRSIDRMRSEVTKLIGINEKAAFNQAEALIERLEQEIDELKKKETGLKQLYSTEDHIHFLQVTGWFTGRVFVGTQRQRPNERRDETTGGRCPATVLLQRRPVESILMSFMVFSPPSELQLPLHPHRWRLHPPREREPRLLLRRRQESRGRDQGAPWGIRQGGAGQDLQVRCDTNLRPTAERRQRTHQFEQANMCRVLQWARSRCTPPRAEHWTEGAEVRTSCREQEVNYCLGW